MKLVNRHCVTFKRYRNSEYLDSSWQRRLSLSICRVRIHSQPFPRRETQGSSEKLLGSVYKVAIIEKGTFYSRLLGQIDDVIEKSSI